MLDFLTFLFSQLGNIFTFLDSFEIINGLSLLRIFIIIMLFNFVLKFLFPSKGGD